MGRGPLKHAVLKHFIKWFPAHYTLTHEQVPTIYREPGLITGYRPLDKPITYYFSSIFKLHNESVNIWTHILAAVLFMFKLNSLTLEQSSEKTLESLTEVYLAFGFCTVSYTLFSAFAHAFHSKSPRWHYVCFQIDYCGIGLYGLGKCILLFYCSCPETTFSYLKNSYLVTNVFLGWILMTGCCVAKLKYRRPYPFRRKLIQLCSGSLQAGFGFIPLGSRYYSCVLDTTCSLCSLNHHTIWLVTMSASLFFFSSHLPEKKYPGKFDFIGQGHQIFHILIALTTLLQYDASSYDVRFHDNTHSSHHVNARVLAGVIFMYLFGSVCIILMLSNYVRKRMEQDKKCH